MHTKGLLAAMGLGAAAGAAAVMMMPYNSSAHRIARKAADKVEHAVYKVGDKIQDIHDEMM